MTSTFAAVPVGGRFEFRGRRYQKLTIGDAVDEERCANMFRPDTEVVPEALPVRNSVQQDLRTCKIPAPQQSTLAPNQPKKHPRIWIDYPGQKLEALAVCA